MRELASLGMRAGRFVLNRATYPSRPAGTGLLVLFLVAGSAPAHAGRRARQAPRAANPAQVTPASASETRPYSDAELRAEETEQERKVREIRAQEISQLRLALGLRQPSSQRADLYLRLAEIHFEHYRAEFLLEGRVHEKRLAEGQMDPTIHRVRSKAILRQGAQACRDILKLGIRHDRLDNVLYLLGFFLEELDERADAVRQYEELLRRFPDSPYASEALRELGDEAYAARRYAEALAFYERGAKDSRSENVPRTLHRLAWTYYRTRQYDRAIETVKQAIARSQAGGEKYLSIREEALRDLAIFAAERGKVEEVVAYFQKTAGDSAFLPRTLERLGRQYERNVELDKARHVFESILSARPDPETEVKAIVKLVELDLRSGRFDGALKRIEASRLEAGQSGADYRNLKAMVRRTATERHNSYRKEGRKEDLKIGEKFYVVYLGRFLSRDDAAEAAEIQMYLADAERELGKSKEASELYRKVVESGDKRYAKEAAALWTASLSEEIRKQARGKASEPGELEKEFIDAADRLAASLGDATEAREAQLKAAQVLAGYTVAQEDAIARCQRIMAAYPRSPQALIAARLWLQILSDRVVAKLKGSKSRVIPQEDAEDLREALARIRENPQLLKADDGKLKALIALQENRLKVGEIAEKEESEDFGGAAAGYERYAAEAGERRLAEQAYANAAGSYVKSAELTALPGLYARWLGRYKGSPVAMESMREAATSAFVAGAFQVAADLLEALSSHASDPRALEAAAWVHEGTGSTQRALQAREGALRRFPKFEGTHRISLALARTSGNLAWCKALASAALAECVYRAGIAARAAGGTDDESIAALIALDKKRTEARVRPFIAYAKYQRALRSEGESRGNEGPKAPLLKRLAWIESITKKYLDAASQGGPWAVAALGRLGVIAYQFAAEIESMSLEPGLSEAATKEARNTNVGVARQFRKRAIVLWQQGAERARKEAVLSPALPGILDELAGARIQPERRAQGPRGGFQLALIGADADESGETVRAALGREPKSATLWVRYGNHLLSKGRGPLARVAYERALALDRKFAPAIANLGVLTASGPSEEDWLDAAIARQYFEEALKIDPGSPETHHDLARLLSYYRLHEQARPHWEKGRGWESLDGIAIARQASGDVDAAADSFRQADELGAPSSRFARHFHDAARASATAPEGAGRCLDSLDALSPEALAGFERESVEALRRSCEEWKEAR